MRKASESLVLELSVRLIGRYSGKRVGSFSIYHEGFFNLPKNYLNRM